jgi:hypothetical protein
MNLLKQTEVAERLGCSPRRVKYLRLTGELPFIRGKPVLVDEADLAEYVERCRRRRIERDGPEPGTPEYAAAQRVKAMKRAELSWLQRQFATKSRAR